MKLLMSFIDDYDYRYFMGYDMAKLNMDTFYLNLNYNESDYRDIFLYTLKEECIECPFVSTYSTNIKENNCNKEVRSAQIFPTDVKFRLATTDNEYFPQDDIENVICDLEPNFKQFGIYNVDVNRTGCFVSTVKDPVNIYAPILTIFLIYCLTALLIYAILMTWKKCSSKKNAEEKNIPKRERVRSLDTFRGITIVLMIFANFGCGGYEILNHAKWDGLHAADLVFPCFMWIMGVCIPISLTSSFKKGLSNYTILKNILKRSIILFCLGIILGSEADLNYLRIFGVLQRFGIAYLVVTTICVLFMKRSVKEITEKLNIFDDIIIIWKGWIITSALVIMHTIIVFCVAAPGCPAGYMGPGGLHKNQSYRNCIGGATGYIDGLILGNHRYQNPTIYKVFEARPFDPEGVVGCLTTIFHVFLGVQAGCTLILFKKHSERLIRWLIWAFSTGLIGGLLCSFSKENGIIPVNKNLWSLSFVMVTSCFGFSLLALCYLLVDVKKWWTGKPFLFAGMNALLMYIGHEMTDGHFPVRWYIHNDLGDVRRTHFLALFSDTWGVGIWILISYYLYKINYFFTV